MGAPDKKGITTTRPFHTAEGEAGPETRTPPGRRTLAGNHSCDTILYYTILYYTILYHTILYHTILYYAMLYYTIPMLYYTKLYYTTPYSPHPGRRSYRLSVGRHARRPGLLYKTIYIYIYICIPIYIYIYMYTKDCHYH